MTLRCLKLKVTVSEVRKLDAAARSNKNGNLETVIVVFILLKVKMTAYVKRCVKF